MKSSKIAPLVLVAIAALGLWAFRSALRNEFRQYEATDDLREAIDRGKNCYKLLQNNNHFSRVQKALLPCLEHAKSDVWVLQAKTSIKQGKMGLDELTYSDLFFDEDTIRSCIETRLAQLQPGDLQKPDALQKMKVKTGGFDFYIVTPSARKINGNKHFQRLFSSELHRSPMDPSGLCWIGAPVQKKKARMLRVIF